MSPLHSDALPIDLERIHDATGGDAEFLAELVDIFLDDAVERLEEIRHAVAAEDETEIRKTAHKLKGSSANMGATGLMRLAKSLEDMGMSGDVRDAASFVEGLDAEFARVKTALERLVAEGA